MRSRIREAVARLRRQAPEPGQTPDPLPPEVELADLPDLTVAERRIIERVRPYTMTGVARIAAMIDAVRYCVDREIPGAFAECGVWRGGSVLAMILTLQELGDESRPVYLYDTFEGMTRPSERDVSRFDAPALEGWDDRGRRMSAWTPLFEPDAVDAERVREIVLSSGYPAAHLHLVPGPVEGTLPEHAPRELALLRLDTDWYESTLHELVHLYPRLVDGGVLIVDDYGHWEGCRRAVDEYFERQGSRLLLNRIDYSARIAVKR